MNLTLLACFPSLACSSVAGRRWVIHASASSDSEVGTPLETTHSRASAMRQATMASGVDVLRSARHASVLRGSSSGGT